MHSVQCKKRQQHAFHRNHMKIAYQQPRIPCCYQHQHKYYPTPICHSLPSLGNFTLPWIQRQNRSEGTDTPQDLIFRLNARRSFKHPITGTFMEKKGKAYLHLSLTCLRKQDTTMQLKDLAINDEIFIQLTDDHLQCLQSDRLLQYILAQKDV